MRCLGLRNLERVMNEKKQTGGPAFPRAAAQLNIGYVNEQRGMTLRDYFAAKAMQSLASGEKWLSCSDMPLVAELAYKVADAMLEARNDKN